MKSQNIYKEFMLFQSQECLNDLVNALLPNGTPEEKHNLKVAISNYATCVKHNV